MFFEKQKTLKMKPLTMKKYILAMMLGIVAVSLIPDAKAQSQARPARNPSNASDAQVSLVNPADSASLILPSQQWLEEVERRAFPPSPCAASSQCVQVQSARASQEGKSIVLQLQYHVTERSFAALPEVVGAFVKSIKVDDQEGLLRASGSGKAVIALEPGVHQVKIEFIPGGNVSNFTVSFASKPKKIQSDLKEWSALPSSLFAAESITFNKLKASAPLTKEDPLGRVKAPGGVEPDSEAIINAPLFLSILRVVQIDPSGASIKLRVERLSPSLNPDHAEVDLWPGEKAIGEDVSVQNQKLRVDFGAGESSKEYELRIPKVPEVLSMKASDKLDRKETWMLSISPRLLAKNEGIKPLVSLQGLPTNVYMPFAGESLTIKIEPQIAAAGSSVAVDRADLKTALGENEAKHVLNLSIRASIAGALEIQTPKTWRLESALTNKRPAQKTYKEGHLILDLVPGQNESVLTFTDTEDVLGVVNRAPELKIGAQTANLNWDLSLPASRWLLWTSGPLLGPSVLFWGFLIFVMAISFGLSRWLKGSIAPTFLGWCALLGPIITIHPISIVVLIGFIIGICMKEKNKEHVERGLWNPMQTALMLMGLISVGILLKGVYNGLLGMPDMMVAQYNGNAAVSGDLSWYLDRTPGEWLSAGVISVPSWVWHSGMLVWALWLAKVVTARLPKAWAVICEGGLWAASAPVKRVSKYKTSDASNQVAQQASGAVTASDSQAMTASSLNDEDNKSVGSGLNTPLESTADSNDPDSVKKES